MTADVPMISCPGEPTMPLTYKKPEHLQLRQHPDFNEAWVQQRIADDPSILGLGEIELLERERSQGKAGRLDLLLSDPDNDRRFEVELMLGATDPSHVIREGKRNPGTRSDGLLRRK